MGKYFSRMGDGSAEWFSEAEIRADIEEGTLDAADRAKVKPLTDDEQKYLFELCTSPEQMVCVERGKEIITTGDSGATKLPYDGSIPMDRSTAVLVHERAFCVDTMEIGHIDYSYKQVKAILHEEKSAVETAQLLTVVPLLYGAMPNLGLYTRPDGPVDNWSELLPAGKIAEARSAQEEAVAYAVKDLVYCAEGLYEAGVDGINFDTVGASGDADVLATLKAVRILKEKRPDLAINLGMAGEFVLGMHGQLYFDEIRLAGLYPHHQVKVAEKAGATIFGAVVNTNSSNSFPWNIARVCTFVKACTEVAQIPVHVNVGMGVGGVPLTLTPPIDAVSRADKALIEIGKADGL
jgi:dimethylamine--corrinoid protein Co-methyltransferase